MSAEQPKKFSVFPQPHQADSSPTFIKAIIIIGVLVLIEILAAGWKLFPELTDQLTSWWATQKAGSFSFTNSSKETHAALVLRRAISMETSGQTAKALALLKSLQAIPNLPSSLQTEIKNHLRTLMLSAEAASMPKQDTSGSEMQDDVGFQPGSTLGIIECRLMEGKPTGQTLRIAMKARTGASIDVQNVKIHVYFYEKTSEGEVVLTDSAIRSEWLTPPVDWANGTPQILDVLYLGSQSSGSSNTFYGYVVGIYYNGELQDSRAVPVKLIRDFPPPLFLTSPQPRS
jgi:hypothetical protein